MNCPSCAAPFQWFDRFAELVVCQSCQATCLVDGASLEVKGKMAVLAPPEGVLSLGAMGSLGGKSFSVVGRVRYAYQRGFWDEWFLRFNDGSQRWVSEDEDKLQVSILKKKPLPASRFSKATPGSFVTIEAESYHVNEKGVAECVGGEGQLPFVVEPGEKTPFLDISRGTKITGSVEFAESGEVRIYLGKSLDKSDIQIDVQGQQYASDAVEGVSKGRFVQASVDKPESYNCYGCGGALPAKAVDASVDCEYCGATNNPVQASCTCPECKISVALPAGNAAAALSCPQCHTCFDPTGKVVSTQDEKKRPPEKPMLKVGDRGTIEGVDYVVTGWVYSTGKESGWTFTSLDYMLYNPDKGYEWLVCCEDHYSIARSIPALDKDTATTFKHASVGETIAHDGRKYKVSGQGVSCVQWVEGQLPYVAKAGDTVGYHDAANAPYLLSMERSSGEAEYFLARYMQRDEVAEAFSLNPKDFFNPVEKAAHQPYPMSSFRKHALLCMLVFLVLNVWAIFESNPDGWHVENFNFSQPEWDQEVLSEPFLVTQDDTVLRVKATTGVNNEWVYLNLGLLDGDRRVLHEFGSTIQYYHGVDGGESWAEGGRSHEFHMKVPKEGKYRLLLMGQTRTYRGNISLEISEGCTMNGMNWVLFLLCLFWMGTELLIWMKHQGYLDED